MVRMVRGMVASRTCRLCWWPTAHGPMLMPRPKAMCSSSFPDPVSLQRMACLVKALGSGQCEVCHCHVTSRSVSVSVRYSSGSAADRFCCLNNFFWRVLK